MSEARGAWQETHASSFSIAWRKNICDTRQQALLSSSGKLLLRAWIQANEPARPAHLLLRVHEAALGHRRKEAWRISVLGRRRHLELKRGGGAGHFATEMLRKEIRSER